MGKLRILSGREVCQILAKHGFKEIRQARESYCDAAPNGINNNYYYPATESSRVKDRNALVDYSAKRCFSQ
jgi:hypothetical protein